MILSIESIEVTLRIGLVYNKKVKNEKVPILMVTLSDFFSKHGKCIIY